MNAYVFLIAIRHGENVRVHIDLEDSLMTGFIPPITIQLLIENAIKHNIFSTNKPLNIHIYFPDGESMVVENNKSPKIIQEPGTNVGLKNIEERYHLLSQKTPVITDDQYFFKVEIPLFTSEQNFK